MFRLVTVGFLALGIVCLFLGVLFALDPAMGNSPLLLQIAMVSMLGAIATAVLHHAEKN
jgi:hypothetical protein